MAVATLDMELSLYLKVPEYETGKGGGSRTIQYDHTVNEVLKLANGTGSNKQNQVWSGRFTSTQGIDLAGSLTSVADPGETVTFGLITTILVLNRSTTSGEYLTVGGSSNPITTWLAASGDGVRCDPNGILLVHSPVSAYAVTAGTGDILTITVATGTPTFDVFLVGRTA